MARALISWGGWEGHEPDAVAALFAEILEGEGMGADVVDTLGCFDDVEALGRYDLIVPVWTMAEISKERSRAVAEAVARGTGLAGCHGGMCDAFRGDVLWQFMTGGNWVAHPGGDGVDYRVEMALPEHELVAGIGDFEVCSEQYYLHVDPAVTVLATTRFPVVPWHHSPNGAVDMPVAWVKRWGLGRVYYNALGHKRAVIEAGAPREMVRRGCLWAAGGKAAALASGERYEDYASEGAHL